jgi:hypothetical protein
MKKLLSLPVLALSACATAAPPPSDIPVAGGGPATQTCSSDNLQQFVGQVRSPELETKMLQVSGASRVRWVPAGTAVTMEFAYGRLTVFLDAQNRVERLSCS